MIVYQVSREFAPLAGAGGLKEVVSGISSSLANLGIDSSVFIPCYGFVETCKKELFAEYLIQFKDTAIPFRVYKKNINSVSLYLIDFPLVADKKDVYTYTKSDELVDSTKVQGVGFKDNDDINILFQISFLYLVKNFLLKPDVINLHDAHTGLIPYLIKHDKLYKRFFSEVKLFFTIHNAGLAYHQRFPVQKLKQYIKINRFTLKKALVGRVVDPLCLASLYSEVLTVSSYYALELLNLKHEKHSGSFGAFCNKNKIKIKGITNGIDLNKFDSLKIEAIPSYTKKRAVYKSISKLIERSNLNIYGRFTLEEYRPLFLFQNRITEQKGIDDYIDGFYEYIRGDGKGLFVIMGQGELRYHNKLKVLAENFPESFVFIEGYSEDLAQNLFLLSDFFVLTSLWEPCGLTDFESQLVGTIPIVRRTGGLNKVIDNKTGFLFDNVNEYVDKLLFCDKLFYDDKSRINNIKINAYINIVNNYTWDIVVKNYYLPIYEGKSFA